MQEITTIISLVQDAGFIGILIVLAIPRLRGFIFNGSLQSQQPQIDELKEHAKVANKEMGEIKKSILGIEKTVSYIKGNLEIKK